MVKEILRLGKQALIYGIGGVGVKILSFLLMPVYTRVLAPTGYGIMEVLSVTQTLLVTVLTLQMGPALFRFYYDCRSEQERADLQSTAFWVLLGIGTPVVMVGSVLARLVSLTLLDNTTYSVLVLLMLVATLLQIVQTVPLAVFRAREQASHYVTISLGNVIVTMLVSVYLVVILHMGVLGVFLGNVIGLAVGTLLSVSILRGIKMIVNASLARQLIRFGVPMSLGLLPVVLIDVSDRYFLNWLSTIDEVGIYAVGYRFGMLIQVLLVSPFVLAWGPFAISVKDAIHAKRLYALTLTYFLGASLFLSLGLALFVPHILRIMTPPSFWAAERVVLVLALSYTLSGAYSIFAVGIYVTKKTQYIPLVTGLSLCVNFIANLALIPRWGMMGAAYATLLAYGAMAGGMLLAGRRLYRVSYEWTRVAKLCIAFAIIFGAGKLISIFPVYAAVGIKGLLLCSYPFLLWAIGFFRTGEIAALRWVRGVLRARYV
jgi:O-antigen/teichoic acid export membrane protein